MLADMQNNPSSTYEVEGAILPQVPNTESEDAAALYSEFRERLSEGNKTTLDPDDSSQRLLRQLSAKLHCLYGVSVENVRKDTTAPPRYSLRSDNAPVHPYARSLVYDLRQHTDHTLWGPFLNDGSQNVDWEKIEAIMIVLDYNIRRSTEAQRSFEGMMEAHNKPFVGASPRSFISPPSSISLEPSLPLEARDPYNITGTWMRIVCFLDYSELYDFNFDSENVPDDEPRQPISTEEAIRLITMTLRVTKIEAPDEEDGQDLPVVHFTGIASSVRPSFDPNANSKTRGAYYLELAEFGLANDDVRY